MRILFLHGFLGSPEDWTPLLSSLRGDLDPITLELPGHGSTPFEEDIVENIATRFTFADTIVGYSAGGRVALELEARFPEKMGRVIAISAHPGLKTQHERKARWNADKAWIDRLHTTPFEDWLEQWYQQPLFETLSSSPVFETMLRRRSRQDPNKMATFLTAFSLAKRPPFSNASEATFICGEKDLKYANLYRSLYPSARVQCISNTGHAVHIENPAICAGVIEGKLYDCIP